MNLHLYKYYRNDTKKSILKLSFLNEFFELDKNKIYWDYLRVESCPFPRRYKPADMYKPLSGTDKDRGFWEISAPATWATLPIRESFITHSEAAYEGRMTSFVYGSFTAYILYYLIS